MKKLRRTLTLLLAAATILGLAACSSGTPTASNTPRS